MIRYVPQPTMAEIVERHQQRLRASPSIFVHKMPEECLHLHRAVCHTMRQARERDRLVLEKARIAEKRRQKAA